MSKERFNYIDQSTQENLEISTKRTEKELRDRIKKSKTISLQEEDAKNKIYDKLQVQKRKGEITQEEFDDAVHKLEIKENRIFSEIYPNLSKQSVCFPSQKSARTIILPMKMNTP